MCAIRISYKSFSKRSVKSLYICVYVYVYMCILHPGLTFYICIIYSTCDITAKQEDMWQAVTGIPTCSREGSKCFLFTMIMVR